MNTMMPIYAQHNSSINGKSANTLSVLIYISMIALALIPYGCYVIWLFPLFFLLKEKDSELVKYSAAQCLVMFLLFAVANFLLTFFATMLSTPSSCVITAIMNIKTAIAPGIIYILLYLAVTGFAGFAAKNAGAYVAYRFPVIKGMADKLAEL